MDKSDMVIGKTYRTISGLDYVLEDGVLTPKFWSKTYEIGGPEDPDFYRTRTELQRIKKNLEELCHQVRETAYKYYTVLSPDDIDPNIRKAAAAALEICRRRLSIAWPMKIVWIDEENEWEKNYAYDAGFRDWDFVKIDEPVWGKTQDYSDTIWILKGLSLRDTIWVVAHETRHVIQSMNMPIEAREAEANAFAYQMINELEAALR